MAVHPILAKWKKDHPQQEFEHETETFVVSQNLIDYMQSIPSKKMQPFKDKAQRRKEQAHEAEVG